MQLSPTDNLEGRKKVRLRLRQNLKVTQHNRDGHPCYVIKDPVTLRYFHLEEPQHFLFVRMDGNHTLEQIQQAYETNCRPHRMSLQELEGFGRQLLESGLVINESAGAAMLAIEQSKKQTRKWWLSLLNIFYIKIPLTNPDRWLMRCQTVGLFVFSYCFFALSLGLFLGALGLLATHWQEFLARLPKYHDFLNVRTIILLWIVLGIIKILHEMGHALCCKRLGAQVQEIGVLVLLGFPTLYCNVSDSWMLKSKWKRMAIGAAGIYVELVLASLATFLWWFSDSNTFLHNVCFAVMTVCSVSTVFFNANPLMRFDGYFILSDWMEIPNLAQQSNQAMQSIVLRWLGVETRQGSAHASFLLWFGVGSAIYRWYVMAMTMFFLSDLFDLHHLGGTGKLLISTGLAALIGVPMYQFSRWLHQLGRFPDMKAVRVVLAFGIVSLLVGAFFLIPIPRKVRGVALVQVSPEQVQRVVVPSTEGYLQEIHVHDGQRVKAGEILAVLVNPKLEIKTRLNDADRGLRNQQQNAFLSQLTDMGVSKDDPTSDWQQCEHESRSLLQQSYTLKEQRDRLILRAPIAGVVMGMAAPEDKGKWLEKGTELCRVGNESVLRALVLVDPSDHRDVRTHAPAWIQIHGVGGKHYSGFVTGIAQVESSSIPPALSSRVAGDIPTQHDASSNTDKPHGQFYLVSVQFHSVNTAIHPGVLGRVKIDADAQTLAWRVRQYLGTTLNWGL